MSVQGCEGRAVGSHTDRTGTGRCCQGGESLASRLSHASGQTSTCGFTTVTCIRLDGHLSLVASRLSHASNQTSTCHLWLHDCHMHPVRRAHVTCGFTTVTCIQPDEHLSLVASRLSHASSQTSTAHLWLHDCHMYPARRTLVTCHLWLHDCHMHPARRTLVTCGFTTVTCIQPDEHLSLVASLHTDNCFPIIRKTKSENWVKLCLKKKKSMGYGIGCFHLLISVFVFLSC